MAVTLTCPSIPEYLTQNDLDRGIATVDAVKAALPDSQARLLQQLAPLVVLILDAVTHNCNLVVSSLVVQCLCLCPSTLLYFFPGRAVPLFPILGSVLAWKPCYSEKLCCFECE